MLRHAFKPRRVVLVTVLALVGIALAFFLLHLEFTRTLVLDRTTKFLEDSYGIEFQAESLDYNLLSLSFRFTHLQLGLKTTPPGTVPLFEAGEASFELGLLKLLEGVPHIKSAHFQGAFLRLATDETGRVNLPPQGTMRSVGTPGPIELPEFTIESLVLDHGRVLFEDSALGLRIDLPSLELGIRVVPGAEEGQEQEVRLRLETPGEVTYRDQVVRLDQLESLFRLSRTSLEIDRLWIASGDSSLDARGRFQGFSELDAQVTLTLEPGRFPVSDSFFSGGRMIVRANVRNPLDRLEVEGDLNGSRLTVEGIPEIELRAGFGWSVREGRLALPSVSIRSPSGRVEGEASLGLLQGNGEGRLKLRLEEVDLSALSGVVGSPAGLAGKLFGDIEVSWSDLDLHGLDVSSELRLEANGRSARAGEIPVSAELSIDSDREGIRLSVKRAEVAGLRLDGRVRMEAPDSLEDLLNSDLAGELRGQAADLSRVLSVLRTAFPSLGQELPEALPFNGLAEFQARLRGKVSEPAADLEIRAESVSIGPVETVSATLSLSYSPAELLVRESTATWKEFSFHSRGRIDLAGKVPVFDLEGEVASFQAGPLLRAAVPSLPVDGQVEADFRLQGSTKDPQGSLRLSVRRLQAWQQTFDTLLLRAGWSGTRMELKELRAEQGGEGGLFLAQGSLDLDSLNYQLETSASALRLSAIDLPGGLGLQGVLDLQASGEGNWETPGLRARAQLTQLDVNGWNPGSVEASVTLDGTRFAARASLPADRATLEVDGHLEPPYPLRAELSLNRFELSALAVPLGFEGRLDGQATAQVRASADWNRLEQGTLTLDMPELQMGFLGVGIQNLAPIRIACEDGLIRLEAVSIASGRSEAEIQGTFPLLGNEEGLVTARGMLDLAEAASLASLPAGVSLRGGLGFEASIGGNLARPRPTLRLYSENAEIAHEALTEPISEINLRLVLEEGVLRIAELAARVASGSITAAGELPAAWVTDRLGFDTAPVRDAAHLELSLKGLEFKAFRSVPEGWTGRMSARVTLDSPDFQLSSVKARVVVEELEAESRDLKVRQDGETVFSLSDSVARIERLSWIGPSMAILGSGDLNLDNRRVNLQLAGHLDVNLLNGLVDGLRAQGQGRLQLAARGEVSRPEWEGFFEMEQGMLRLGAPRLQAQKLNFRANLLRDRLEIERFEGELNGGSVSLSGGLKLTGFDISDLSLTLNANNVFMNSPEGLRTGSDAVIRLRSEGKATALDGQIDVLEGAYTQRLDLEEELLRFLRSSGSPSLPEEQNPFLSALKFNLGLNTRNAIQVRNNLADLRIHAALTLGGSFYEPSLTGRIRLEEGGKIYLRERTYLVDRGSVFFLDETALMPTLDVLARTSAKGYDINLAVSGDLDDIQTTLTSDPPLAEPDIVSVLVTGRTLGEVSGAELNVAQEQALSFLAGSLGQRLSTGAETALGLSRVRIEPHLISPESDPSARLTVGQDVNPDLRLIYSMNLADSGDQIYIAEYDLPKGLDTRGIKQADNTYRFEFSQTLRFGGDSAPGAGDAQAAAGILGHIDFRGESLVSEDWLRKKTGLKSGSRYDIFRVQDAVDRLGQTYRSDARLESRVNLQRSVSGGAVNLLFEVEPGPRVDFVFEGWSPSKNLRTRVREAWTEGVFDQQRVEDSLRLIRESQIRSGYPQSRVSAAVSEADDEKKVVFQVDRGTHYPNVELVFEGAEGVSADVLRAEIEKAGLRSQVLLESASVTGYLARFYRMQGYLDATLEEPRFDFSPDRGLVRAVFPVKEGPLLLTGEIVFRGNQLFEEGALKSAAGLSAGAPFKTDSVEEARKRIEDLYKRQGFNDVRVQLLVNRVPGKNHVDVTFETVEQLRGIVEEIQVSGNGRTSEAFIRRQLAFRIGDPLDFRALSRSRKSLYDSGAFALVEIKTEELGRPSTQGDGKPVRVIVNVHEVRPFQIRYGGFFDTDRGLGVTGDFRNENSLGSARTAGVTGRYDNDVREVRAFFSQPYLRSLPWRSTISGFVRREIFPVFITDRVGVSLQQENRLRDNFVVSYGYRFERNDTYDKDPDSLFQILPFNVAALTATLTRDSRDNVFDATRGSFFSQALEFAPSRLGSDIQFIKYFGQYSRYFPLGEASEVPFGGGLRRSRLVFATGVRVGLAAGLAGQELIFSERFFAGGGTTLRGFEQDTVGPRGFFGSPVGGDALFILNNELRFPIVSLFDGVAFLDVGNVYRGWNDFDPRDARQAAGLGIRVRTPYLLLRLDYGWKLDRRDGESPGAVFFSIGQAF